MRRHGTFSKPQSKVAHNSITQLHTKLEGENITASPLVGILFQCAKKKPIRQLAHFCGKPLSNSSSEKVDQKNFYQRIGIASEELNSSEN
jgi:hypothetical protein